MCLYILWKIKLKNKSQGTVFVSASCDVVPASSALSSDNMFPADINLVLISNAAQSIGLLNVFFRNLHVFGTHSRVCV